MLFDRENSIIEKHRHSRSENRVECEGAPKEAAAAGTHVPPGRSILNTPAAPLGGRRSILEGHRTRALRTGEIDPRAGRSSKRHRFLCALAVAVLIAAVAIVAYGYWALEAFHGRLNLLPDMQSQLVMDGHRIDAARRALQDQQASFGQRVATAGSVLTGRLQPPPERAELKPRTAALQRQITALQSVQQSADEPLNDLQGQANQLKSQPQAAPPPGLDAQAASNRVAFEASLQDARELSPGIRLEVSRVDTAHQRYDATIELPGGETLVIHNHPAEEVVKFYSTGDSSPEELVVTQVTKNAISGFLEMGTGTKADRVAKGR